MTRAGWVGLGVLQATLVVGVVAVERSRRPVVRFGIEPLDEVAPALRWERPDGVGALPEGPVLVHFWATWCLPCAAELPGLVAAASAAGVPVLAVTDEPWAAVDGWSAGEVPRQVVRDPTGEARGRWGVSALPETYLVDDGRIRARIAGARDWTTGEAGRFLGCVRDGCEGR